MMGTAAGMQIEENMAMANRRGKKTDRKRIFRQYFRKLRWLHGKTFRNVR
jgi:ABC-type uncharacterized transport system ATPase component